jgi:hypothetical protein
MEFHSGCGDSFRDLRTTFKTGTAAPTERLISYHHTTWIIFITLTNTIDASIHAGPAVDAVLIVNGHMVPGESLPLFTNLLVESRSDHIEKPKELRAIFDLLNEAGYLLNREVDGPGEMGFKIIVKWAVFDVDLALFITAATVKTEVEGQNFGQLDLLRLHCPLHCQKFASCCEGFISGGAVNRASGDTISALSTGEDLFGNPCKSLGSNRQWFSKSPFQNDGEEFEEEPIHCCEFEIKDVRLKDHPLKRAQSSRNSEKLSRIEDSVRVHLLLVSNQFLHLFF